MAFYLLGLSCHIFTHGASMQGLMNSEVKPLVPGYL